MPYGEFEFSLEVVGVRVIVSGDFFVPGVDVFVQEFD